MQGEAMARKATVDKNTVLEMLQEGRSTQYVADQFGVSRQAIDLHRKDFINQGLLRDQRAFRKARTVRETVTTDRNAVSLEKLVDLVIEAFSALKQLPELEAELEKYRRDYESAIQEIGRLKKTDEKWKQQELRWFAVQEEGDSGSGSGERG